MIQNIYSIRCIAFGISVVGLTAKKAIELYNSELAEKEYFDSLGLQPLELKYYQNTLYKIPMNGKIYRKIYFENGGEGVVELQKFEINFQ